MPNETHKHYHINVLPQDADAYWALAVAAIFIAFFWSFSKAIQAGKVAEVEKAKYEAQAKISR